MHAHISNIKCKTLNIAVLTNKESVIKNLYIHTYLAMNIYIHIGKYIKLVKFIIPLLCPNTCKYLRMY